MLIENLTGKVTIWTYSESAPPTISKAVLLDIMCVRSGTLYCPTSGGCYLLFDLDVLLIKILTRLGLCICIWTVKVEKLFGQPLLLLLQLFCLNDI